MFKLVVLCAFFAAAAAKPGALIPIPITQYPTFVAPATTTIAKQSTSIIHPTPIEYYSTAPLAYTHFIKKRSAQLPVNYITPTTYIAPSVYQPSHILPLNTPYVVGASPIAPVTTVQHLIKKRSAPLLPTTYIAPQTYLATGTPILTTSYASTAPLITPATPLISQPLVYQHLIKKRSAPLLTSYVAPISYSQQSRFDLKTTHQPISSIYYSPPIAYSNQYTHLY